MCHFLRAIGLADGLESILHAHSSEALARVVLSKALEQSLCAQQHNRPQGQVGEVTSDAQEVEA